MKLMVIIAFTSAFLLTTPSCFGLHHEAISTRGIKLEAEQKRQRQDQQQEQRHIPRNKSNSGCPAKCSQCSPFNGCITCRPRNFLAFEWQNMRQTGICVPRCPQGFYPKVWNPRDKPNKRHGKCSKCTIKNCEKCKSNDRCGLCTKPHLLYRGHCLKRCPPKTQLHPEERRCRKLSYGDCKATPWSKWSKCLFKSGSTSSCLGFQTRSRSFLYKSFPHGIKWMDGQDLNLLRGVGRMDGWMEGRMESKIQALSGNKLLKRHRKPSSSKNELPIGSNSTIRDLDLYQKFEVTDVVACPEPEIEYRKCHKKDRRCRETTRRK